MGIDHATIQRLYRQMKADNYDGSIAFFICEKLCDEVLGKTKDGLRMLDNLNQPFPKTEELAKFVAEKDEDVLFCALQGALIQSGDKVGKKCLDIIANLYLNVP